MTAAATIDREGIVIFGPARCARCGRFVRNVIVTYGVTFGELDSVKGIAGDCRRCGCGIEVQADFLWAVET